MTGRLGVWFMRVLAHVPLPALRALGAQVEDTVAGGVSFSGTRGVAWLANKLPRRWEKYHAFIMPAFYVEVWLRIVGPHTCWYVDEELVA